MSRFTKLEVVFILLTFGLVYATLNPSFTGDVTFKPSRHLELDGRDYVLPGLMTGEVVGLVDGDNHYSLTVSKVYQDYATATEFLTLVASPGQRMLRLKEGETIKIDFNNDGFSDAFVGLEAISNGKAWVTIVS